MSSQAELSIPMIRFDENPPPSFEEDIEQTPINSDNSIFFKCAFPLFASLASTSTIICLALSVLEQTGPYPEEKTLNNLLVAAKWSAVSGAICLAGSIGTAAYDSIKMRSILPFKQSLCSAGEIDGAVVNTISGLFWPILCCINQNGKCKKESAEMEGPKYSLKF
jgi:hypothetical protein